MKKEMDKKVIFFLLLLVTFGAKMSVVFAGDTATPTLGGTLVGGNQVEIDGSGFTPTNNAAQFISTTDATQIYTVDGIASNDGSSILLTVPLNIPAGTYNLTTGSFNSVWSAPIPVTISNSNTISTSNPFSITSITPSSVKGGDTVTIKGNNFLTNEALQVVFLSTADGTRNYYPATVVDAHTITFFAPTVNLADTYSVSVTDGSAANPFNSITSNSQSLTVAGTLPPPTGLVTAVDCSTGNSNVKISWSPAGNASPTSEGIASLDSTDLVGYSITVNGNTVSVPASQTSYTLTNLAAGSSYPVSIVALYKHTSDTNTTPSAPLQTSVTPSGYCPASPAPLNLSTSQACLSAGSTGSITATWQNPAIIKPIGTPAPSSFVAASPTPSPTQPDSVSSQTTSGLSSPNAGPIAFGISVDQPFNPSQATMLPLADTTYTTGSFGAGSSHTFYLAAEYSGGNWSSPVSAVSTIAPFCAVPPTTPTTTSVTPTTQTPSTTSSSQNSSNSVASQIAAMTAVPDPGYQTTYISSAGTSYAAVGGIAVQIPPKTHIPIGSWNVSTASGPELIFPGDIYMIIQTGFGPMLIGVSTNNQEQIHTSSPSPSPTPYVSPSASPSSSPTPTPSSSPTPSHSPSPTPTPTPSPSPVTSPSTSPSVSPSPSTSPTTSPSTTPSPSSSPSRSPSSSPTPSGSPISEAPSSSFLANTFQSISNFWNAIWQ